MVMGPAGLGTKDDCAGKGQQQFASLAHLISAVRKGGVWNTLRILFFHRSQLVTS
jgi:hypothetical protein